MQNNLDVEIDTAISANTANKADTKYAKWLCSRANISRAAVIFKRARYALLAVVFTGATGLAAAEELRAATPLPATNPPAVARTPAPSTESATKPRTFDKRITDKLGVRNVAYLLAVDVNGKVTPFVSNEPKASFRIIDPSREKLTMDLSEIEPFTIVAGKRNPFCVLFIGGSGRKLWMEACP